MIAGPVEAPSESQTGATGGNSDRFAFRSDRPPSVESERSRRSALPSYFAEAEDRLVSSISAAVTGVTAPGQRSLATIRARVGETAHRARAARLGSTEQYLALARATVVKRLLTSLEGVAAHAQTASAGVYVYQIDRLSADAIERLFDDGFLDLLLAVRNALVINNAWMCRTREQIETMQGLVRRYAPLSPGNGQAFRRGIVELNQLGVDTTPFEIPAELVFDAEE